MLIVLKNTIYVFDPKKVNPLDTDNTVQVHETENCFIITRTPKLDQEFHQLLNQHGFKIEGKMRRERKEPKFAPFSPEDIATTKTGMDIFFCLNKKQDFRLGFQWHGLSASPMGLMSQKLTDGDTSAKTAFVDRYFKGWAVARMMDSKGNIRQTDADKLMKEFSELATRQLKECGPLRGKFTFSLDEEGKVKYEWTEIK